MALVMRIVSLSAFILAGSTAAVRAEGGVPGLRIAELTLSSGALVITGLTAQPRALVEIVGTGFKIRADADKRFRFRVFHRTLQLPTQSRPKA